MNRVFRITVLAVSIIFIVFLTVLSFTDIDISAFPAFLPIETVTEPTHAVSPTEQTQATTEPTTASPPTEPSTEPAPEPLRLSFVGDCLIASAWDSQRAGNFNDCAKKYAPSYFFEKVYPILSADDYTLTNCENVLSNSPLTKAEKDYEPAYWFIGPTSNAAVLSAGSVEIAGVCNNHTRDYGDAGYYDTVAALEAHGVIAGEGLKPVIISKNGKFAAVFYCGLWSEWDGYTISNAVRDASEIYDYVIVFFHGGIEKAYKPEAWMISAAHSIADAGADIIVGSHPHVLQPMEIYNGVPIVYSLGNFCYGGNNYPENRTVIFTAELTEHNGGTSVSYDIHPCYVYTGSSNNWQPALIEDEAEKNSVLRFMHGSIY